ncbi:hypothetical protein BREVNS_1707 [Brevinematales bacterium NS]|nr:hypothetical protein BREVNS_0361 [Brevinematales bacterium NS]QJR21432.1 hypothetical protein BREVNS_0682 [Brevinematales bacterium NS]QJR21823.1 hypothetical protein BREVNS_1073 [Brevinematales bacterium NS]QJR22457.1 hypothetical protein BREVNS_1707 [Brevinematales bacterium NS]
MRKIKRRGKGLLPALAMTLFQQNLPLFLWTRTEFALWLFPCFSKRGLLAEIRK